MAASSPANTQVQDFASPGSPAHLAIDTQLAGQRPRGPSVSSATRPISADRRSTDTTTLRRRFTRSNTVTQYQTPISPSVANKTYQRLEPGAEPGVNTQNDTHTARYHDLQTPCQITVVDYSSERIESHDLDNDTLEAFLKTPKENWVACRWINVNGLSWDVVRLLGNHKQLHRLAIEDLLNTKSRTKVDWYADQAFSKSGLAFHGHLLTISSIINTGQARQNGYR